METHSGRRIAGQARAPGLISVYVATCSAALNRDLGTWARVGYCYRIRILMYLVYLECIQGWILYLYPARYPMGCILMLTL